MNFKLMIKNSFMSIKREFHIFLSLLIYLSIGFSLIFGTFSLSSELHKKMVTETTAYGTNVDNQVTTSDFYFFVDRDEYYQENKTYFTAAYDAKILAQLNTYLPSGEQLKQDNKDDKDFLVRLGKARGQLQALNEYGKTGESKYEKIIATFHEHSLRQFGNIFAASLIDLMQQNNIIENVFLLSSASRYIGQTSAVTVTDFNDADLNLVRAKQIDATQADRLNIYAIQNSYDAINEINHDLNFVYQGNTVNLSTTLVGTEDDKVNLMQFQKYAFAIDSTEFYDYICAHDKEKEFFTSTDFSIGFSSKDKSTINDFIAGLRDEELYQLEKDQYQKDFSDVNFKSQRNLVPMSDYRKTSALYTLFAFVITLMIVILTFLIMYFVMKDLIRSDRQILSFLKSLGTSRLKLTIINVVGVIYPILFSLIISIPVMFVIRKYLFDAIGSSYNFSMGFFDINYQTILTIVITFIVSLTLFSVLIFMNVSEKSLNPINLYQSSRTERFLNKFKPGAIKFFRVKDKLWLSFFNKNFYQTIVSFIVLSVTMGVLLFGMLLNYSIRRTISDSEKFFDPYTTSSTYSSATSYLDNGNVEWNYKYVDQTLAENENSEDNNRRIYVLDHEIEYYKGKEKIDIEPDPISAEQKIKEIDFADRYITKADVNKFIDDSFDATSYGPTFENIINNIRMKADEVKEYYPDYAGTNVMFRTNYKSSDLNELMFKTIYASTTRLMSQQSHWSGNISLLKQNVTSQFADLKEINYETKYHEYKITKQFRQGMTQEYVADHLVDTDVNGTSDIDLYSYEKLIGSQSDVNFSGQTFEYSIPEINIIVPKILRDRIGDGDFYLNVPIFKYTQDKNVVVPIKLNVVDITDATPINNLFVNDDEFENAMDEALKVVQAGVEDYFGKDNTSPIAHLLENYLTERSNETAFYTKTNNSFFDEGMPRGFEYLTLAPYGDPNEIASYNLSINTIDNYPVTVDDFKLEALTKKRLLDPVQQLVKNISFLATTMAILISLILIYLILKENNRIIKILKIMGYRKKEIIKYLIFGYVLSSILAGALAILISYLMYKVITDGLSSAYKIQFVCHYSVGFVLTDIFIVLGFVLVVFLSILFVSRKTKVNSIEQAN